MKLKWNLTEYKARYEGSSLANRFERKDKKEISIIPDENKNPSYLKTPVED